MCGHLFASRLVVVHHPEDTRAAVIRKVAVVVEALHAAVVVVGAESVEVSVAVAEEGVAAIVKVRLMLRLRLRLRQLTLVEPLEFADTDESFDTLHL